MTEINAAKVSLAGVHVEEKEKGKCAETFERNDEKSTLKVLV